MMKNLIVMVLTLLWVTGASYLEDEVDDYDFDVEDVPRRFLKPRTFRTNRKTCYTGKLCDDNTDCPK